MSFSECSSLLFSNSFLLFLFSLKPLGFFLIFFFPLVFLYHSITMSARLSSHAEVQQVVKVICVLDYGLNIKLDLAIELGNK